MIKINKMLPSLGSQYKFITVLYNVNSLFIPIFVDSFLTAVLWWVGSLTLHSPRIKQNGNHQWKNKCLWYLCEKTQTFSSVPCLINICWFSTNLIKSYWLILRSALIFLFKQEENTKISHSEYVTLLWNIYCSAICEMK